MGTVYRVAVEEVSEDGCCGAWYMHDPTTVKEAQERSHGFWDTWWREPDNTMRATMSRDLLDSMVNALRGANYYDWVLEFGCKHCGRVHFVAGMFDELRVASAPFPQSTSRLAELVVKCDEPPFSDFGASVKTGKVWLRLWEEVRIGPRSRLSPLAC